MFPAFNAEKAFIVDFVYSENNFYLMVVIAYTIIAVKSCYSSFML